MRGIAVGSVLIVALLSVLWTLYYWVPGFKAVALGEGRALSGPEALLIRMSDFVVINDYAVFSVVLAASVWIGCSAFAADRNPAEE